MRKSMLVAAAVGIALLIGGVFVASNMGFKLNYTLLTQAGGGTGQNANTIGLPYFRQQGVDTALDLIQDISGTTNPAQYTVASVNFYNAADGFTGYSGQAGGGTNFNLNSGEAYLVKMATNAPPSTQYIIVGSHDPALTVTFDQTTPQNATFYSVPYHSLAATAEDLIIELGGPGGPVASVAFYNSADGFTGYTGQAGGGSNFNLNPGESYLVKVNSTINIVPAHY